MAERFELSIPGAPSGAGHFEPVHSPYSGELIGEVEFADAATASHVLARQSELFADQRNWLPTHERIAILERTADLMRERRDELARRIALEGGKPWKDAVVEADRAINGVELCAEEAANLHGEHIPMGATPASAGRLAVAVREPIGLVAAVSAFNHPLNLIVHQVGPAVAMGCPVVVKPATVTPLSCIAFVEILREAGLAPEWCVALPCDNATAEALVTSDRIGFFTFIGSGRVGWHLRSKLAPGTRCALEHGGVAPVVVDETADLDRAVPLLVKGGYYHAGQVCVSVQRVFAHRSVQDELVQRLTAAVGELRTGDPLSPDTDVGPLIKAAEVNRVGEWVSEAVDGGAALAIGGKPIDHQCYEPTLLVDPPGRSRAMTEEIFGPVVCVTGYDDIDDAIGRANSLPYAFQAAVFTRDHGRAMHVARNLNATAVMVNDHTAFRVDWMPFGGRGESGLGMGGIPCTAEDMTRLKMYVLND